MAQYVLERTNYKLFCIYIRSTLQKGSEESTKVPVEEGLEVSSKADMCE
jgi:hypothetical protein